MNRDHCQPTDLTPLLYRRQRPKLASAQTEPLTDGSAPSLPSRPRKNHATLPPTNGAKAANMTTPQTLEGLSAFEPADNEYQTLRIKGLPLDTPSEGVKHLLEKELTLKPETVRIGPIVPEPPYKTTTATFASIPIANRALSHRNSKFTYSTGRTEAMITSDAKFDGFTTIYEPKDPSGNEPDVDIILVHDRPGHPINSFASHYTSLYSESSSVEKCWPRDDLPQLLEAQNIYPRVMTYGWSATLWLEHKENSWLAADEFISLLGKVRPNPKGPLIFIGHGLGSVLVKLTKINLINSGLARDDEFVNPVKLCVFFGIPSDSSEEGTDFTSPATRMKEKLDEKLPTAAPAQGLAIWNTRLITISDEFAQIQSRYGINQLCFAETLGPNEHSPNPESSSPHQAIPGNVMKIGARLKYIAKLRRGHSVVNEAFEMIVDDIMRSLSKISGPATVLEPSDVKNIYKRLGNYDTVFLVDDSGSIEPYWPTTARVLANIISIVIKYNDDGVDVKFFNKWIKKDNRTNLNTTDKVMALFAINTPLKGATLTADVLEEVLNDYMFRYRRDRNIKGLNLVVLTDAKHKLDQDMIDTVYWVEEDKDRLHEKILLGGILKHLDNDQRKEL
ncbi:MAG: hypothetical protein Q9225_005321 [Loekoesia sp. 1 TL-2023]